MRDALAIAALVAFAPMVALASGARFLEGEVSATAATAFPAAPKHGYAPAWVELANDGAQPREVTVSFAPFLSRGGRIVREVVVDPGERRVVSLPVPPHVRVGALRVAPRGLPAGETNVSVQGYDGAVLVAGSEAEAARAFHGSGALVREAATYLDARHLPDSLAGYVGYRGVVLLDPAVASLDRSQRAAIEAYALTGGEVVFAGEAAEGTPALDTWRDGAGTEPGFGRVRVCRGPCGGFGEHDAWYAWTVRGATDGRATPPERAAFGDVEPPTLLPDVGRTPVGVFLLMILVFAAAIGPGNFLLARRRGRHLILITTPALALVTCGGIAGYGIAADGLFTVHTAARSVTILDHEHPRAATLSVTGVYAALGGREIEFPAQHAPLLRGDGEDRVELDWTRGPTFGGDFVPARAYRERALALVQPTRARLVASGDGVLNALGSDIERGLVRLGGETFVIERTADGAAAVLARQGGDAATAVLDDVRDALRGRFSDPVIEQVARGLERDEFLAIVSGAGFAPVEPFGGELHASTHVVRGKVTR